MFPNPVFREDLDPILLGVSREQLTKTHREQKVTVGESSEQKEQHVCGPRAELATEYMKE